MYILMSFGTYLLKRESATYYPIDLYLQLMVCCACDMGTASVSGVERLTA